VPGEDIDVVVLAAYLKRCIDGTATIQPGRHPRDRDRLGFTVGASSTLNLQALEDLISDTKKWKKEQMTREFRRDPYVYIESDTFADRRKNGPTPGSTAPKLAKGREMTSMRGIEKPRDTERTRDTGRELDVHPGPTDGPDTYDLNLARHQVDERDSWDIRPPPYPSPQASGRPGAANGNRHNDAMLADYQEKYSTTALTERLKSSWPGTQRRPSNRS
jgi:hypothetical protein